MANTMIRRLRKLKRARRASTVDPLQFEPLPRTVIGSCLVRDATLSIIDERCDIRLGWSEELEASWHALGLDELPGRVTRLDRGWSTVLRDLDAEPLRIRNIGADVAVGDWVVPSVELDRVEAVLPRRSAFVRRASFEGSRAESQTIAANIDVVMLVHALTSPPNQRRLERELGAGMGQRRPSGRRADQARSGRRSRRVGAHRCTLRRPA